MNLGGAFFVVPALGGIRIVFGLLAVLLVVPPAASELAPGSLGEFRSHLPGDAFGVGTDGERIYVFGGSNFAEPHPDVGQNNKIHVFDPASDHLVPLEASLPTRIYSPNVMWTGREFILAGGYRLEDYGDVQEDLPYGGILRWRPGESVVQVLPMTLPVQEGYGARVPLQGWAWSAQRMWGFHANGTVTELDPIAGTSETYPGVFVPSNTGLEPTPVDDRILVISAPDAHRSDDAGHAYWFDPVARGVEEIPDAHKLVRTRGEFARLGDDLFAFAYEPWTVDRRNFFQGAAYPVLFNATTLSVQALLSGPLPERGGAGMLVPVGDRVVLMPGPNACWYDRIGWFDPTPPSTSPHNMPPRWDEPGLTFMEGEDGDGSHRAMAEVDTCTLKDEGFLRKVTVDWGDGETTTRGSDNDSRYGRLQHRYRAPGNYSVTVTATDDWNLTSVSSVKASVRKCAAEAEPADGSGYLNRGPAGDPPCPVLAKDAPAPLLLCFAGVLAAAVGATRRPRRN